MTIPPSSRSLAPPSSTSPALGHSLSSEWADPRFRRLLAVQMAFGYAFSALLLVPKFATAALHASPQQVGELAAYPVVASVLIAPLCGRWLDAGGFRSCLWVGAALVALSTAVLGFVQEIGPAAYGLRALQGIGNSVFLGGSGSLVTRLVAREHHGRAFGTVGAAALLMNALGSSTTERLAEAFGWTLAFGVAALVALVAVPLSFGMPAAAERLDAVGASPSNPGFGSARSQIGVGAGALAAGMGFGMLATFTQPYALSLGAEHVAILFVGYTCTALFVRLGLGTAVDRWGRRRAAFASLLLYALTALVASSLQPSWLFFLGLGFGVAHGLAWPSLCALAVENAAPTRVGTALTRVQALFGVGSMTAVWCGGHLVTAFGYPLAFTLAAAAVAILAFTLGFSGGRRRFA